jgi:ketosteroid isomerase-like protein
MLSTRRTALHILALSPAWAAAQPAPTSAESQLRSAIDAYLAAWTRRDVDALSRLHTEDTLYIDPYLNEKKGRGQLAGYMGAMVRLYDLRLNIERMVVRAGGTQALLILRERYGELPRKDGRYVRDFDRSGIFSRWRRHEGGWQIEQFVDSTIRSADFIKAEGL